MTKACHIHRWHAQDHVALPDDPLPLISDGPIAYVVINRAQKRNAITQQMWQRFSDLADRLCANPEVKLCVIRGAGGEAFSGGADIAEFPTVFGDVPSIKYYNAAVRLGQSAIERLPMPTLAVIEGACVGGGCGLAMACDFRFAADTARFSISPAKLGSSYSVPDTRRLVSLVGAAHAKDILCTGRVFSADAAQKMGLVNEAVPAEQLEQRAAGYAQSLLANSSHSIAVMKELVNAISGVNPKDEILLENKFESCFSSLDFRVGYEAFLQKRRPVFSI